MALYRIFSANKCHHFEGAGRIIWSALVPYNTLKILPSVPCEQVKFFLWENTSFLINRFHETAAEIEESEEFDDSLFLPSLFSWLTCVAFWLAGEGLPFSISPRFSVGVCGFESYWFWWSGAEDLSWLCWRATGWGKSDKLKKVWDRTLYRQTNQRNTKKKKWRFQCLVVVAIRSL